MPDRFGRLTTKDRRSAALLRLMPWAGEPVTSVANPDGLRQAIQIARNTKATDDDIALVLGCCRDDISHLMED